MKKLGFSYFVNDEMLKEYCKMAVGKRLEWLYAANKLRNGLSKKIQKIQDKFRKAEI